MTTPPPLPAAATPTPGAPPVLSAEHLQQLAEARQSGRKVRRAIGVATFDGWTIGAFGFLTLLIGITDLTSILMGVGMAAIAWLELRGAARLRRLEAGAGRALGFNQ